MSRIEELISYEEFLGNVVRDKIGKLKERFKEGRYTEAYLVNEVDKVLSLLDKYTAFLVKLRKEFGVDYVSGSEWEREVIWELRALDPVQLEVVKSVIKMLKNGKMDKVLQMLEDESNDKS